MTETSLLNVVCLQHRTECPHTVNYYHVVVMSLSCLHFFRSYKDTQRPGQVATYQYMQLTARNTVNNNMQWKDSQLR